MLQVFYLDVAKVDLDVAYICMLQAYVSSGPGVFIRMFASVSSGCCICLQWFLSVFRHFPQVFQMLISCVSSAFRRMLLVLYSNIAKVDRDIAHVVIAIHVCFKCMFQIFHVSNECCMVFIWMFVGDLIPGYPMGWS